MESMQEAFLGIGVSDNANSITGGYNAWDYQYCADDVSYTRKEKDKDKDENGKTTYTIVPCIKEGPTVFFNDNDFLALEYQRITCDRRRGEIAKYFVDKFMPLVKKKIGKFVASTRSTVKDYYYDEGMAIWNAIVCEKLQEWTGESTQHAFCSFDTFLFYYAESAVTTNLQEKHAYKDMKYTSIDKGAENEDTGETFADVLNGGFETTENFRAYEASLIFSGGLKVDTGDTFTDAIFACEAMHDSALEDGVFSTMNTAQWDIMKQGSKKDSI